MGLLKLEPDTTLVFVQSSHHQTPMKTLRLTNAHKTNVAFKVKTTAPKAYLVRPSTGTLLPGQGQDIQILFQLATGTSGQGLVELAKEASAHRFLVQSVAVSPTDQVQRETWSKFSKDQVQEHRLNVDLRMEPEQDSNAGDSRASPASDQLQKTYDDLVAYTLKLEKEKKQVENELANWKSRSTQGTEGPPMLVISLTTVISFILAYLLHVLFAPP